MRCNKGDFEYANLSNTLLRSREMNGIFGRFAITRAARVLIIRKKCHASIANPGSIDPLIAATQLPTFLAVHVLEGLTYMRSLSLSAVDRISRLGMR